MTQKCIIYGDILLKYTKGSIRQITESCGFTFLAQSVLGYCLLQYLIEQFYQLS